MGIKLTPVTYSVVIDTIIGQGGQENISIAFQILDYMDNERTPPNEVTYGIMLKGIIRDEGLSTEVVDQFVQDIRLRMKKHGLEPNRISRNLLIASGFQRGDGCTDDVLAEWDSSKRGPVSDKTYYILLQGFLAMKNHGAGQEVIQHMQAVGFEPRGALKRVVERFERSRRASQVLVGQTW